MDKYNIIIEESKKLLGKPIILDTLGNYIYEDGTPVSSDIKKQLDNIINNKIKDYNIKHYKKLRQIEYAKLNQFELLYDDMLNGTTKWKDAILEIKNKYPKERI